MNRKLAALAFAFLLAGPWLAVAPEVRGATQTPSAPVTLALQVTPSVLPADGGVYAAIYVLLHDSGNLATLATSNVTVILSSSNPNVGVVMNSSVFFLPGQAFAVVDFATTTVAGVSTVTASATGLASATTQVKTSTPTGFPSKMVVSAVPSDVPVLPSYPSGIVIVELEDQSGLPAKAVFGTPIQLISSNQQVLNVTGSTTIPAGQISTTAGYSTGPVPGSVSILAAASGYASGTATVTVSGTPALQLQLTALPAKLANCPTCTGMILVSVTDPSGSPVHAPSPIAVHLRSNDTSRISPPTEVTIPEGNVSTKVVYSANLAVGGAQITASAAGLSSSQVNVATYTAATVVPGSPVDLKLEVGPSDLPADDCKCGYATVSIVSGSGGLPLVDTVQETITLTSSQAFVANFSNKQASVDLQLVPGTSYVSTVVISTYVVGSTILTASAEDRISDFAQVSTTGPVFSQLEMTPLFGASPVQLPADGASHPAFQLGFFDASGNPALAPANTVIHLNSSQTGAVQVPSTVEIPSGRSAVMVNVTSSVISGTSAVIAYASLGAGPILSSSSLVRTTTPAPSALAVFVAPSPYLLSSSSQPVNLIVQLQDGRGNPSRAHASTALTVTSSKTSVYNQTIQATIAQGASFVAVPVRPLAAGTTSFTATSPGLSHAAVDLTVDPPPYTAQLLASRFLILTNETATMTVTLTLDGQGVSGTNVTWTAAGGRLVPAQSTTNPKGRATSTLIPLGAGGANVTASAFVPGLGAWNETVIVQVQAAKVQQQSILAMLLSFPYYLILAGGAAAAVVAVLFVVRRRRKKGKEKDTLGEFGEEEPLASLE